MNGLNNNEAKRVRLDQSSPNPPSKVIHIRNIPSEVTEAEVIHLGIPFGRVTNVLVLKGKNQVRLRPPASNQLNEWLFLCPLTRVTEPAQGATRKVLNLKIRS